MPKFCCFGVKRRLKMQKNSRPTHGSADHGPPTFVGSDPPLRLKMQKSLGRRSQLSGRTFNSSAISKNPNSILMVFLSSVVARWGPKSAQIEKCDMKSKRFWLAHFASVSKERQMGFGRFPCSTPESQCMSTLDLALMFARGRCPRTRTAHDHAVDH